MPNYATLIRNQLKNADKQTKSLQTDVVFKRWGGYDGTGEFITADTITVKAFVEMIQKPIRTAGGQETISRAKITILENVAAVSNAVEGRNEPIDEHDIPTLPDGTTGKIIAVTGMVDPLTDLPYFLEVWLG